MKKFLLSMLLALLCQLTANAQPPSFGLRYGCIKVINGVQYLVFEYHPMPPGSTVAVWYQGITGPEMVGSCSTSTQAWDPNVHYMYFCINPANPLSPDANGCVDFAWSENTNNFPPPDPGPLNRKICPCENCDARFSYCIKDDGMGNWIASFTLGNVNNNYKELVIDGVSTGPIQVQQFSPQTLSIGSHTVCIRVWDAVVLDYCEYCVNLCVAEPKRAMMQDRLAQVQGSQSDITFSQVKIYPNPSSSSTKLEFSLLEDQQLTIELVDISGHVVSKIKDEKALAGYHAIDISTANVPSGTYIVRMRTGHAIANYRLSVVK